jgi:FKBP-type peptidyl-prolyl cis-trans isomerase SlyD
VCVGALEGADVLLDANHPLAGEELHFEVELITARPATPEELPSATDLT